MPNFSYLVVRVHPDTPVDSGTFGTYLDGLSIKVYRADAPQTPANLLGQVPPASGLSYAPVQLIEVPFAPGTFIAAVPKLLVDSTKPVSPNDYGNTLTLDSIEGIAYGSSVVSPVDASLISGGTAVNNLAGTTATVNQEIPKFLGAGTVVTFYYQYGSGQLSIASDYSSFSFVINTAASATNKTIIKMQTTKGIAPGMTVSAVSGVAANTLVTAVSSTTITLSNSVTLANNAPVTFTCLLNTGIVQHVEPELQWDGLSPYFIPIPMSVATAVIPIPNQPVGEYVDIAVVVTRNNILIPVDHEFYNVMVLVDTSLPSPGNFQNIPLRNTSFYLTLPAPPVNNGALSLLMPTNGTAPAYDQLLPLMEAASQYDSYFSGVDLTQLTTDQCTRMAYDIVWSQQNPLPLPPDALEDLYTNPPNSGASSSNGNNNGDEQDRQRWEGALNSFYSTRNSVAVRLSKFVAAVSCALYCEATSTAAPQAVLEFIVDPTAYADASPIVSEVLLTGLNSTINFGVPAAFFYALGSNQGITTTAASRYKSACGDTVDRLLQEFGQAVMTGVITDLEAYSLPLSSPPAGKISSVQAARRLSALAVTQSSTTPIVPLPATTAFDNLVQGWLGATTASAAGPSYQAFQPESDAIIWALLAGVSVPASVSGDYTVQTQADESGYLYLVLSAISRGYIETGTSQSLASKVIGWLPSTTNPTTPNPTIDTLKAVTAAQWTAFFTTGPADPTWLPPFTQPGNNLAPSQSPLQQGYVSIQIKAFIRAVQKFFSVSSIPNQAPNLNPAAPSLYSLPDFDAISQAVGNLSGTFVFGAGPLTQAQIDTAVQGIFPPEEVRAQAWLARAIGTINDLALIAKVVPEISPNAQPTPGDIRFSIMEALYARGFTSASDITKVTSDEFQYATTGTVAWGYVPQLYAAAQAIAPNAPQTGDGSLQGFVPVNPDGSLTDCIPPPSISPLGPAAYLKALLALHQDSSCANLHDNDSSDTTPLMAATIASRRGPVGDMLADRANSSTLIPSIDLVNESLEKLAALAPAPTSGAVYDTATTTLDGYPLCTGGCSDKEDCHSPGELLETMPQYSSPAVPTAQPDAYKNLATDFSSCCLPYSQPLDISRTYQRLLCLCRADTMRAFRKEITEFVLAPDASPSNFQNYLWRYPVKIEIAIEYLGFSQQEAAALFGYTGVTAKPIPPWGLYGFASAEQNDKSWIQTLQQLSEFLERTCLTYCEFIELQAVSPVPIANGNSDVKGFSDCEPCCLDGVELSFGTDQNQEAALAALALFIRVWRALKHRCDGFSFAELADIWSVLGGLAGGVNNIEFLRQLAALEMLRDYFHMPLTDAKERPAPGDTGADRTNLLAFWVGPSAAKWNWAVGELLERVPRVARAHHRAKDRAPEFLKLMASNLDPLSRLGGFDPSTATDTWYSRPTCTLRFAEVLTKIYASEFSIGDIVFLTSAAPHPDDEDTFPLQDENEALDHPLDLPEDQPQQSLHALRHKLLAAEVNEDGCEAWTWHRISTSMQRDFGYVPDGTSTTPDTWQTFGKHFFPNQLAASGISFAPGDQRFVYSTSVPTPPLMWNVPANGPFQCAVDSGTGAVTMWCTLPLRDEAVIEKLTHVRPLGAAEQDAVRDLYFQPRAMLAQFAFLFTDFASADRHLIQEPDEEKRWDYFRHHFAIAHERCRIITEHLAKNIAHVLGCEHHEDDARTAWLVLRDLLADENAPVTPPTWEDPSGKLPAVTWKSRPNGGAFAALLGLTGTGLLGELSTLEGKLLWREMQGPFCAFANARDQENTPVPTIMPQLGYTPPMAPELVSIHNGFAVRDMDGSSLGGAQGYQAQWSGVLLVDREGRYEFDARVPQTRNGKSESHEDRRSWKVVLSRNQKTWLLLKNHWPEAEGEPAVSLNLKRGAYQLLITLRQETPDFSRPEWLRRQHAGLELDYRGPDTQDEWTIIPRERLYLDKKDGTLGKGIDYGKDATPTPVTFLDTLYTSSLRDIRRTYQRAFKAVLFVKRFHLSSKPASDDSLSELGYMLAQSDRFAGVGFARSGGAFNASLCDFDFNFLPLKDNYLPPSPAQDLRVAPGPSRVVALFDQWERLFDYTQVRQQALQHRERPVWLLFDEALNKQPAHVGFLLRHLGIDSRHYDLLLNYYVSPTPGTLYALTAADLEDDRWMVRVWHGEQWIRTLLKCFCPKDLGEAQPATWAGDDPGTPVGSLTISGNQNLVAFVCDGFFGGEKPWRYAEIKRANDGLRERARKALIAYLCHGNRLALPWNAGSYATCARDLSDYLLQDVEAGLCQRASRVDEAVSAVHSFVRRARLGLEPGWTITRDFAELWDCKFSSFHDWQASREHELYRENWAAWEAIEKARKIEAFRFLESELKSSSLSIAEPGGGEWWPDQRPAPHAGLGPLQADVPSTVALLPANPPTQEGFTLLGTPENSGQPSWLAIPGQSAPSSSTQGNDGQLQRSAQKSSRKAPRVAELAQASAQSGGQSTMPQPLPFWIEAAMRLGAQFVRVAAACSPAGSSGIGGDNTVTRCCEQCGAIHPPVVDEYYFWLIETLQYVRPDQAYGIPANTPVGTYQFGVQDAYYDQTQQQSVQWNNGDDSTAMAKLLNWPANPAVRLAWCRVHNGKFMQERRSTECIPITSPVNLQFLGRALDSLYFSIGGGSSTTPPDGFRFDLPSDFAVVLPLPVPAPAVSTSNLPGQLNSYPYFVYDTPGASLYPTSIFAPAITVASALRARCRYDLALKWYDLAFAPLKSDCAWVECPTNDRNQASPPNNPSNVPGTPAGAATAPPAVAGQPANNANNPSADQPGKPSRDSSGACCDSTDVTWETVRDRALTLEYCDTLLEWGWHAMRHRNTPEKAQQARQLFDTVAQILGKRPRRVKLPEPKNPQSVATFTPAIPCLNPRLLELYDRTADRLRLVHECIDAWRLPQSSPYFGADLACSIRREDDCCTERGEWCLPPSPYRFTYLIQKAVELASSVREFGSALLAAMEKGDAEILASIRAAHEHELAEMQIAIRQDQWRSADWQVQSLQQTKDLNQTNLIYYTGLYQNDLINNEIQYESLSTTAMQTRTSANMVEAGGEAMKVIPDLFVGFPCNDSQVPIGTKLAGVFETIGKVISIFADIQSATAALDLTLAGWERRSDDWLHQTQTLPIEIQQIEYQILSQHRQRDQAMLELDHQQRQVEQTGAVLNYLRDKFTSDQLYLWMQKETLALYHQMYELALHTARQA
ncbi:MAG: hypothetical protein P4L10_07690, partial [Acidobacteriaceae bacterium]|nr:hypothetical protein [Acidobacteriaceae bacterium]